jgi:hypothetical protein
MIHPRPRSSIPRKTMDPIKFRTSGRREPTHIQAHELNRTSIGKTGHHVERVVKSMRRLMFKLMPYEKED